MKGVIPFRGVKMPSIRKTLHQWYESEELTVRLSGPQQTELALALMKCEYAEEKLAGILLFHEILIPARLLPWKDTLPHFVALYQNAYIFDWNVCDWFCVKVLSALIDREGQACAEAIASWHDVENLWQARSSLVAFINHTGERIYFPLLLRSASTLIQREERFAKTAVGWVLRDVSLYDRSLVKEFIRTFAGSFSRESLRNITKHFPEPEQTEHRALLKSGRG